MIYKYKINYKSIGGSSSSSSSSTSSSSTSSNSTTLENKIKYIDNIIDNLGYEEGNNRIFYITEYTPMSGEKYDYVQDIKKQWEESKNLNPNERIIELLNLLDEDSLKIENFNIFYTKLIRIAVRDWFDDQNIYGPISNWDTSYVTSMSYLFNNRENFDEDISRWNVSNVTDMSYMFKDAKKFNGDISSWNTSNVRFMHRMFEGAESFNGDISSWNVSNVTRMSSMFKDAKKFNGDISSWNTSNVRFMDMMFEGAESFNQNINTKPIKNSNGQILYTAWDVSNVVYLFNMFLGATSFNGIVSDWTLDPSKFLEGTLGGLGSGLNITLHLKKLGGNNREKITINPFYTVAHLKQKLYDLLINKYGDLGNYRFLNILIDIPSEERRNLSNEDFLQRARLQDQRELRSYGIKNNDTLTYIKKTREEN